MDLIDRVVKFWSDRFVIDEKRKDFEKVLRRKLIVQFRNLTVDYDPWDALLEVVNEIGIECSGYLYSAEGIFSHYKISTYMPDYDKNEIRAKDGYGNFGYIDEKGVFHKST